MPDYSRGKIYKIVCNETGLIYVGSTCEPTLARRLAKHVGDYKCWKKEKRNFVTSYKILEKQNYDIVLLESCSCESKDELHKEKDIILKQHQIVLIYASLPEHKVNQKNSLSKQQRRIIGKRKNLER